MSVFKCKMCGGTIEFEQGATIGVCDSCGTKQTLPKTNNETIANLFNRANNLRLKCEFDKAAAIYEKIVEQDDSEAEAHWGIVLCKYGIEYVDDPATGNKIPTCHRTLFEAVTTDADYQAAIDYSDAMQQAIYETEARTIDRIQKDILNIVKNEKPFDVFICYKETDENGKRTQDSAIANDIYYQLTQEGFKVFYAAITLEDKIGQEYEPYIFAALNSAKVMLVVGTNPMYFNAVWVRNEWSRYLKLMKTDRKKLLIPCYRDMDAYELPEEFAHLQAQDMSKIGFINDVVRGIKKVITADTPKTVEKETIVVNSGNASTAPLLERAFLFLEDGKWQDANIYCEKVLDIDPKNAEAYLGKLMAELQVRTRKQLADCGEPFDDRDNYSKVLRFGDEKLEAELRSYIAHINERKENDRLTGIYNSAKNAMKAANTEDTYQSAAHTFQSIQGFQDADSLAKHCLERAEVCRKDAIYFSARSKMSGEEILAYEEAISLFRTISGWKDAKEQIPACQNKIEEIKAKEEADRLETERRAEEARIAAEKAAKKRKKIFAIATPIACSCIAFIIFLTIVMPNIKAKKQIEALQGISVGDTIKFGFYEQDNNTLNGKEDIEWRVLVKEGDKILVISEYALDCQPYNTSYTNVTWKKCSLRSWLNETFFKKAFDSDQQAMIESSIISADKNPEYSTNPGSATTDKVFLLSITEAEKYFTSDKDRKCVPTAYAIAQGAYTNDRYKKGGTATCRWLLRSPGCNQLRAAVVIGDGLVHYAGDTVNRNDVCVRPALWINLDD